MRKRPCFSDCSKVVVELLDVLGIGVEASRGPDPALELDEGVEGGKVNGAARTLCGRVLLNDLIGPHEPRHDEEITHSAGDVRLRLAIIMPPQNLGGSLGVPGFVVVYLNGHLGPRSLQISNRASRRTRPHSGALPIRISPTPLLRRNELP